MDESSNAAHSHGGLNPGDPWRWNVQDVVDQLCGDGRKLLLGNRPNGQLPEPDALARLIKEQNVDGPTLLEHMDRSSLRDFLGITSLGEVSAMLHVVNTLRSRSSTYQDIYGKTSKHSDPSSVPDTANPRGLQLVDTRVSIPEVRSEHPIKHGSKAAYGGFSAQRPNESYVEDPQGRKRRKLNLTAQHQVQVNGTEQGSSQFQRDLGQSGTSKTDRDKADAMLIEQVDQPASHDSMADATVGQRSTITSSVSDVLNDETSEQSNEWDFLAHWHTQKDDELLPCYGDSQYSDKELENSLIEELEAEQAEIAARDVKKHLSKDEVLGVVKEEIDRFKNIWTERKLPLRRATAWKTWEKGERVERQQLRENALHEIRYLENRQKKIVAEISGHDWLHTSELRKQCVSIEQTINEVEEARFRYSVWLLEVPPKRPETMPKIQRRLNQAANVAANSLNDDDSIIISSEEEILADDISEPTKGGSKSSGRNLDVAASNSFAEADFDWASHDFGPDGLESLDESSLRALDKKAMNLTEALAKEHPRALNNWTLLELDRLQDARRIVMKILSIIPAEVYNDLLDHSRDFQDAQDLLDGVGDGLNAFYNCMLRIPGYDAYTSRSTLLLTRLFLCYFYKSSIPIRIKPTSLFRLGHSEAVALKLLARKPYLDSNATANQWTKWAWNEPVCFLYDLLESRNKHRIESRRIQSGGVSVIPISDSDEEAREQPSTPERGQKPVNAQGGYEAGSTIQEVVDLISSPDAGTRRTSRPKQRVRQVYKDRSAVRQRDEAHERLDLVKQRSERFQLQKALSNVQISNAIINPSKADYEPEIYINPHIARFIQPHQIEGVQFMWSQTVMTGDDEDISGCLLAHSMGLGKTLQAITLISTIAEAGSSKDLSISAQIPERLKTIRCVVVCPAGLVPNWEKELIKWVPRDVRRLIGGLYVYKDEEAEDWYESLLDWHDHGGVAVMGYERFRRIVSPPSSNPIDNESSKMKAWLLKDANLIIADEAHKFKSKGSSISQAIAAFQSRCRIAMTGSPLSNNLSEYFQLINWVAPGYLGSDIEFRAYYEEPIRDGGYQDSTDEERRKAYATLRKLEHECAPKVHKRDRSVLDTQLEPKVEFILTVPLTAMQVSLYTAYVEFAKQGTESDAEYLSRRFSSHLNWIDNLGLINAHPYIFSRGGLMRAPKEVPQLTTVVTGTPRTVTAQVDVDEADTSGLDTTGLDTASTEGNVTAAAAAFSPPITMLQRRVQSVLAGVSRPFDPMHSYRVRVCLQIIQESVAAGDQILVFSHSLDTLKYLERLCGENGIPYLTIDGSTAVPERERLLEKFNAGHQKVALLSIRVGALGFNITGANRAIIFDFKYNPQWEEQAISRVYRLGQKKKVFIYRLLAGGTFEEKQQNIAIFKTQLATKVVKGRNTENMAQRRMQYLQSPVEPDQIDLEPYRGVDPVLDQILDSYKGNECCIRKIATTDALEIERFEEWTSKDEEAMHLDIAKRRTEQQTRANLARANPYASTVVPNAGDLPLSTINSATGLNSAVPPDGRRIPTVIELQARIAQEQPNLDTEKRNLLAEKIRNQQVSAVQSQAQSALLNLTENPHEHTSVSQADPFQSLPGSQQPENQQLRGSEHDNSISVASRTSTLPSGTAPSSSSMNRTPTDLSERQGHFEGAASAANCPASTVTSRPSIHYSTASPNRIDTRANPFGVSPYSGSSRGRGYNHHSSRGYGHSHYSPRGRGRNHQSSRHSGIDHYSPGPVARNLPHRQETRRGAPNPSDFTTGFAGRT